MEKAYTPLRINLKPFRDAPRPKHVTSQMIKKETQVDPVLSQVYNYVISGWPCVVDPTLVPFKTRQDELSTQQVCVLWGARVIVPPSLQDNVLQKLHDTHPGIS